MKKPWRGLLSLTLSLALPVAVVFSFPYSAIGFKASPDAGKAPAAVAFIALSSKAEATAVMTAKSVWHGDMSSEKKARTYLPLGDLPEDTDDPILDAVFTLRPSAKKTAEYLPPPLMPTMAAPAPVKIAPEETTGAGTAFPREELLEMKGD